MASAGSERRAYRKRRLCGSQPDLSRMPAAPLGTRMMNGNARGGKGPGERVAWGKSNARYLIAGA